MQRKALELEILTPERSILTGEKVVSVILPGEEGYLGVLLNHAPIAGVLTKGVLIFTTSVGDKMFYAISGGFFEVYKNNVTVLANSALPPNDIDLKRANESMERAIKRIEDTSHTCDKERARASLERAKTRIKVSGMKITS